MGQTQNINVFMAQSLAGTTGIVGKYITLSKSNHLNSASQCRIL